jgi:hypothetical protein
MPKNSPYPRQIAVRPFKPRERALGLPLLALLAFGAAAFFVIDVRSHPRSAETTHTVVPGKASDMLASKDWSQAVGAIDAGEAYLDYTYGRGAFADELVGLSGKVAIDGAYEPIAAQGFYRVQIRLFNRLQHAVIAIANTKAADVSVEPAPPQPFMPYRKSLLFPQSAEEASRSSTWTPVSGTIGFRGQSEQTFPVTPITAGGPSQCGGTMAVRALIQAPSATFYWVQCATDQAGHPVLSHRIDEQAILDGRLLSSRKDVLINTPVVQTLMN